MAIENITSISIKDVRKLIEDKNIGESVFDAVDKLLGLLLVFSPIALGPAALPLLGLIEPKNELVATFKNAARKISKSDPEDYLDQASRMAAANTMLTYTAFFEAFRHVWPRFVAEFKLTDADGEAFLSQFLQGNSPSLASLEVPLPHPADLEGFGIQTRRDAYSDMAAQLARHADGFPLMRGREDQVSDVLAQIPPLAERLYQAEYLGLAAEYHQFFTWTVLRDQAARDESLRQVAGSIQVLAEDQQTWFELIARAMHDQDLGFQELAKAIAQLPQLAVGPGNTNSGVQVVAEELHRTYAASLCKEVIDGQFGMDDGGPPLRFPRKIDAFVPQSYRVIRYDSKDAHLERDDAWENIEVKGDVGAFIMRHLESPYSVQAPLLVLGHPGSGKSILTEVLGGHLAYPGYTTIRVKLRDINPDITFLKLLEDQIQNDTGGLSLPFATLASGLMMSPPVIILDGYDELLQATGQVFADYLEKVREFQDSLALHRRAVRVIVTSRLTLIDRAIIPPGTTVVRLEEFDEKRCVAWSTVWNERNAPYFEHTGTRPFALPVSEKLRALARQPLLLLMLAIYDAAGNELSSGADGDRPDIDQTVLYDRLLRRFIERELGKPEQGIRFRELSDAERADLVSREMDRLGVAAIGMFNRQDVKIHRDQLNDDLKYFGVEREIAQVRRVLSQAELLLGSFFFVHESSSKLREGNADPGAGPAAFEFLHNTFGEFLAADFIMRRAIEEAQTILDLSANQRLAEQRSRHLATLTEGWFGCLIHTPLFTRPVILSMLREWSRHQLSLPDRTDLLAALDEIVATQLRAILNELMLPDPDPSQRALSRYARLSRRGHLAIYSLNLVLLRAYIGDEQYVIDEADLAEVTNGCRPWESLVSIWRSWFTLDSLSVLAAWMTATRQDIQIVVRPTSAGWVPLGDPKIYLAHSAGVALADNLIAAVTGLHIASLDGLADVQFTQMRDRIVSEVPELLPNANLLALKLFGADAAEIPTLAIPERGRSGYMVDFADVAERMTHTPQQWCQVAVTAPHFSSLLTLSRYDAEVVVASRMKVEPYWLLDLLGVRGTRAFEPPTKRSWRQFLLSPAAAPVLRAAVREFDRGQSIQAASRFDLDDDGTFQAFQAASRFDLDDDGTFQAFDVDTAASLAVFLYRGLHGTGCVRSLQLIAQECGRKAWRLLDIPMQTWGQLTDLLKSTDPGIAALRDEFIPIIGRAVADSLVISQDSMRRYKWTRGMAPFWVSALRMGATSKIDQIIKKLGDEISKLGSGQTAGLDRKWVFSLIGWLHENGDLSQLRQPLTDGLTSWVTGFLGNSSDAWDPGIMSVEQFGSSLTYKEADDLRWLLSVLKDQPTGPPPQRQANHRSRKRGGRSS